MLLLLEHPPTITLGRGADRCHLLADETALDRLGVTVVDTDRGGDITFHGPGQLVGYPIVNLVDHRTDIDWYLRTVEGVLIEACGVFGLHARRFPPHTGVWVGDRKIAAIGVKVRRWVTSHGFAMNVRDLSAWFGLIVPCGLAEYGVTSVEQELGRTIPESDVRLAVAGLMEARFASAGSGPPGSSADISRIIGEILPKRLDSPSGAAL